MVEIHPKHSASLWLCVKKENPNMKQQLRKLFAFILTPLEAGNEPYAYKPSHRTVLIIMGSMFTALAGLVLYFAQGEEAGYFIPVIVFGALGILSIVIGAVGSDRAVSKIWGSGKR